MRLVHLLLALLILIAVARSPALAYTDPGTGSLILQLLFAAAVGLLFHARRAINWVRGALSRRPTNGSESPDHDRY